MPADGPVPGARVRGPKPLKTESVPVPVAPASFRSVRTPLPVRSESPGPCPEPEGYWLDILAREQRWVWPGFLEPDRVEALRDEVYALRDADALHQARIGRARGRVRDPATRGDWIHWLDGSSPAQADLLARYDDLRIAINRSLMLGLFDTEAHFALYPPGTHYARHLDAFQEGNLRRLSLVLYLNRHWRSRDGGELALYDAHGVEYERIHPTAGTLVMFFSRSVPHAVLPTRRWRASIAAWMRVRDPANPLALLP